MCATTNDSFLNNIRVKRQHYEAPPTAETTEEPEKTESPEDSKTETTAEDGNKKALDRDGLNLSSEFIVETEDLIIPEFLAFFDPDDEAEAEDFELDDKKKAYLIKSWDRYLDDMKVKLTPKQQLGVAHGVGYGGKILVSGLHKVLELLKENKAKTKAAEQNSEASLNETIRLQRELNESKGLNPDGSQKAAPQQQAAPVQQPATPQPTAPAEPMNPEQGDTRESVGVETPTPEPNNAQPQATEQNGTFKPCANDQCKKTFKPGEGFAKKTTSPFYDTCCSRKCMNRVIGTPSLANPIKANK